MSAASPSLLYAQTQVLWCGPKAQLPSLRAWARKCDLYFLEKKNQRGMGFHLPLLLLIRKFSRQASFGVIQTKEGFAFEEIA